MGVAGGGSSSSTNIAVPINNYMPVVIGGTLTSGDVGNGPINQTANSSATGGTVSNEFGFNFGLMNLRQLSYQQNDVTKNDIDAYIKSLSVPHTQNIDIGDGQTITSTTDGLGNASTTVKVNGADDLMKSFANTPGALDLSKYGINFL